MNPELTLHPVNNPTPEQLQRAIGALVGAAVGDALGAPFEFGPAGRYSARFPHDVVGGTGEMVGGGGFGWAPGEFTDDTQMALVLAESLLDFGGLALDDVFARFRTWALTAADVGINTRWALGHPSRHEAAAAAERLDRRSAGNGALMRVTPMALAFAGADTATTMAAAVAQAGTTHHDPAAAWGAAIQAELVRRALHGADPLDETDAVLAHVPEPHRSRYSALLRHDYDPHPDAGPGNGTVWTCLAQAVWANRHGTSFGQVMRLVIDLGGDTDTVATVAGALAGARLGPAAIPSRWTTYVHGTVGSVDGPRTYRLGDVQVLARRLMGRVTSDEAALEPAAGPVEIEPRLHVANFAGALTTPDDWAVVSLCRTGNRFASHPVRRELFLFDNSDNFDARVAVEDAVDTIDAFLVEGRTVVLHCHGGRSRTGLVAKAWAMRSLGLDVDAAHQWLKDRWSLYERWNASFDHVLDEWSHG